jgi:hypothetical protein
MTDLAGIDPCRPPDEEGGIYVTSSHPQAKAPMSTRSRWSVRRDVVIGAVGLQPR